MLLDAEAAAGGAGAIGVVEREQPRLDLGNGEAGNRAGEFFRKQNPLRPALVVDLGGLLVGLLLFRRTRRRVGVFDHGEAFGELQRGLKAFGEALADVGADHDAVDHHVDVVREFLVERRRLGELIEGAVDLDALKALLEPFGELFLVLALAAAHDRRQQIEAGALGQRQHAVDHLRDDLAFDRQPRGGRIGHADARPQQAHVVVDLGDGADGGARVFRRRLLLDRDRGRQAVDLVDVRLLHHLQELARIGRERFDVAALALGIDGVEGERGFAGAGEAGEHHELVARNFEIDVLEIVLARAADGYRARCGAGGWLALRPEHFIHIGISRRAGDAPRWARIAGEDRDQAPMIESRNIGRTMRDFQCRVRIINGLFALLFFWQQQSAARDQELLKYKRLRSELRNGGAGSFSRASLRSDSSRRPERCSD